MTHRRGFGVDVIDCDQRHRATSDPDLYEVARILTFIDDLHDTLGTPPRSCPGGQHQWMPMRGGAGLVSCPKCHMMAAEAWEPG